MPNCKICGEWCYPVDIDEHERNCKEKLMVKETEVTIDLSKEFKKMLRRCDKFLRLL